MQSEIVEYALVQFLQLIRDLLEHSFRHRRRKLPLHLIPEVRLDRPEEGVDLLPGHDVHSGPPCITIC
nr:MAG TPA: hypothetical protein [Caudoviricetes sp.]